MLTCFLIHNYNNGKTAATSNEKWQKVLSVLPDTQLDTFSLAPTLSQAILSRIYLCLSSHRSFAEDFHLLWTFIQRFLHKFIVQNS